jgi:hypothetical protein
MKEEKIESKEERSKLWERKSTKDQSKEKANRIICCLYKLYLLIFVDQEKLQ